MYVQHNTTIISIVRDVHEPSALVHLLYLFLSLFRFATEVAYNGYGGTMEAVLVLSDHLSPPRTRLHLDE